MELKMESHQQQQQQSLSPSPPAPAAATASTLTGVVAGTPKASPGHPQPRRPKSYSIDSILGDVVNRTADSEAYSEPVVSHRLGKARRIDWAP